MRESHRNQGAAWGETPNPGPREPGRETHPRVAATGTGGARAQHRTCLFPCPEHKFTAPRSRGLPAKDDLLHFQNTAEKSVSALHAQTQQAAFPGAPGEGSGERQGTTSRQQKGSAMSPATPFPTSRPPRGQAALQQEQLGKAPGAILVPGTSCALGFFPGRACTVLAQGQLRSPKGCGREDHEQDGSETRRVG